MERFIASGLKVIQLGLGFLVMLIIMTFDTGFPWKQ